MADFNLAARQQDDSIQKVLEVAGSNPVALQASGSSRAALQVGGSIITAQPTAALQGLGECPIALWRN